MFDPEDRTSTVRSTRAYLDERLEGLKRPGALDSSMSQATKIVVGTIGITGALTIVLILQTLLA
jgi:hypothetical protein